MADLILHPTDVGQWHAIVIEAQISTNFVLAENTESYLVFLLMRFTKKSRLIDSVLALDFLEAQRKFGAHKADTLRDIGDKSLLLCGLFPGIAKKRMVGLDYFVGMGQAAYLGVSELYQPKRASLYTDLSQQFTNLQIILQTMRGDCLQ